VCKGCVGVGVWQMCVCGGVCVWGRQWWCGWGGWAGGTGGVEPMSCPTAPATVLQKARGASPTSRGENRPPAQWNLLRALPNEASGYGVTFRCSAPAGMVNYARRERPCAQPVKYKHNAIQRAAGRSSYANAGKPYIAGGQQAGMVVTARRRRLRQ